VTNRRIGVAMSCIVGAIISGCQVSRAYRQVVEVKTGSPEERMEFAGSMTVPEQVSHLRAAVQSSCPSAHGVALESLTVNEIVIPAQSSDKAPTILLQLGLEYRSGEDTEAIVNCGKALLEQLVQERGPKQRATSEATTSRGAACGPTRG
jgi:hypothetical protein